MGYFSKEADIKIWESVDAIDSLNIKDINKRKQAIDINKRKQAIFDIIENFGKWLHIRTCDDMIDLD